MLPGACIDPLPRRRSTPYLAVVSDTPGYDAINRYRVTHGNKPMTEARSPDG